MSLAAQLQRIVFIVNTAVFIHWLCTFFLNIYFKLIIISVTEMDLSKVNSVVLFQIPFAEVVIRRGLHNLICQIAQNSAGNVQLESMITSILFKCLQTELFSELPE